MKQAILILAMHRSGTSALTRVTSLLGAALPKSILGKNESNLRGHWESEVMITAHDALLTELGSDWKDWRGLSFGKKGSRKYTAMRDMFLETLASEYSETAESCVIKEPRICRFAAPYIEAVEEAAEQVHILIMVRNPLEVAASLASRDGLDKLDGLYLWLTHMLEAERASRGKSRQFLAYDDFLAGPVEAAERICHNLPRSLTYSPKDVAKQINAYVSPKLKRQTAVTEDIVLDDIASGWVSQAYEALLVLSENTASEAALKNLDAVSASFLSIREPLHAILTAERKRLQAAFSDELMSQNDSHVTALEAAQADNARAWALRDEEYAKSWLLRDEEHNTVLTELNERHAGEISQIYASHDKARAEWETRFANLKVEKTALLEELNSEMNVMRDEFGDILRSVEARVDHTQAELGAAELELASVLNSTSWKMTAGVRRLANILKGVKSTPSSISLKRTPEPPRLEYKPDK